MEKKFYYGIIVIVQSKENSIKRTDGLLFKFALIFTVFALISLLLSGIRTYVTQIKAYKAQCLENVRNIGDYLEKLIQDAGKDFVDYQNFYMAHYSEADIPYNFTEYHTAQENFQFVLNTTANGDYSKLADFDFNSLPEDAKMAHFIYIHEYWLLTFENARKSFNLPYTYYLVPDEENYTMMYMIDGERTHRGPNGEKAEEGEFLYLGDSYYDDPKIYTVQWNSWFSGVRQNDFQVWDNEWGHTYAYYTPLIIDGQKLGLIGTEIQVSDVNSGIIKNTLRQTGAIAGVLVVCIAFLLLFLNDKYINKIVKLETYMNKFTTDKDKNIVNEIEQNIKGKDEISSLSHQFTTLVLEIEEYMHNLIATYKELSDTKRHASMMNELANKDPLTGIRNKNAYDNEVLRLESQISSGNTKFGLVMIDLNFLKQTNDTYGHEHGNTAIKKLCQLVCSVFNHSPVFRIGGDEFVVILENSAYVNVLPLIEVLNKRMEELKTAQDLKPWEKVSAAVGYALYDEKIDSGVSSVFERADTAMYNRKKAMKALRTD